MNQPVLDACTREYAVGIAGSTDSWPSVGVEKSESHRA
jgi:hypothetical protein